MNVRRSAAVSAAALALGGSLAATTAATAAPTSHPTTSVTALSSGQWGPYTHKPTTYWPTGDFVPTGRHVSASAQCWNGGDGTQVRVQLVRTKDKHVMAQSSYHYCTGQTVSASANVATANGYYLRISLKGKPHTIKAWANWS
ncbi:hypothetical protein ACFWXK_09435 [Streptomyces sp. NPDC059070]|uniref:hypothetical protein n=1 Tax=unclassified Streptomyces TaxID=2593676 RepID=UPI0034E2EDF1